MRLVPNMCAWLDQRGTWSVGTADDNPQGRVFAQFSSEADDHYSDFTNWGDDVPTALATLVLGVAQLEENRDLSDSQRSIG